MKLPFKLAVPLLGGALLTLTACQPNNNPGRTAAQSAAPANQGTHNLNSTEVIPSQYGHKQVTTNEHGGTSYGLGSSVYSMIGSSGLHSEGFSSHLESRLSGEGIGGIKAFVFDDTVILATEKREAAGSTYDAVQQKVLSYNGGQSSRGREPASPMGTTGTDKTGDDNLALAQQRVKDFVGGNVKVLTATGPEAIRTINRLRAGAAAASLSPETLSDDLRKLLKMTGDSGK